jgi:hypothetical protein
MESRDDIRAKKNVLSEAIMQMSVRIKTVVSAVVVGLAVSLLCPLGFGQEKKPDAQKIYAEIAGEYSYSLEGQEMLIAFWVKDEKLYGAPRGQEAEYAEITPVDLEKLKFGVTVPNGQYYEIDFSRDENQKITKSVLRTQGMEIPGVRIK